ncbi:Myb/SANT-like domain [Sesbania bispinosa]|nr:Myb/SANT-like domain [Sesbania bispinosa]
MDSENNMQQNNKRKRDSRQWSKEEDEAFLDILIEAVNLGQRCDTGQFKPHTLGAAETKLELKFLRCGIKVKPHIESAMKRLRGIYNTLYDMLNQSGFGWDYDKKIIKVDSDDVWNEYVKSHPSVEPYRYAATPLFDKPAFAFEKDRATVPPGDVVEELDRQEEKQNGIDDI